MSDPSSHREILAPVADGPRPLWSVMIPTYNCAHYLRETLASVLAQDPGPEVMQIEVVDDASTLDDPEAVVAELGRGRVGFHRQPRNVGHARNFRTCLERSRGEIVHLLHGDDAVVPGFYERLGAGFATRRDVGAAFCRHVIVMPDNRPVWTSELERETPGVLENWLERIAVRQLIQTPSIAVRREVYERLGFFDTRLTWSEDWEMWCRIAANYPVWYEPECLAHYRLHEGSSTSNKMRTGETLRDVRRAAGIIAGYLPSTAARRVWRISMRHWARDALTVRVPILLRDGEIRGGLAQLREALRCDSSAPTLLRAASLAPRFGQAALRALTERVGQRG
ncbi:glycosyltransferase family 2 protein [Frigidibacter sp. MR17.24]|uniref:glycosyltransferase family 2 protein n=1 Tax=Frigidibacter sp. MR17.24 TaxID=3127345 RepID=UPI003012B445